MNCKWAGGFAVKHCFGNGLVYRRPKDFGKFDIGFMGFSDSSWADCPFTRRSSGGYLVFFFGMLVSWSSGKTKSALQSTSVGEAEMWFAYLLAKELVYLMDMALELDIFPKHLFEAAWQCVDSKSTIEGLRLIGVTARNKHWDIRIFYMRALNNEVKRIRFLWVDTTKQHADIMTKNQPAVVGKPNREYIRGSPEDQEYFVGIPSEISSKKMEEFIFLSGDKGQNWYLPSFAADFDGEQKSMIWMADGSSELQGIKVKTLNRFRR
jgi:hypothetical protein